LFLVCFKFLDKKEYHFLINIVYISLTVDVAFYSSSDNYKLAPSFLVYVLAGSLTVSCVDDMITS